MPARVLRVDPSRPDPESVEAAARALREGRLVVFPTETVYGFAARADDPAALEALRRAKGRDGARPFSLHLPTVAALRARFPGLGGAAARLAARRLPGPITLVLPGPGGESTGVRVPDDAVARAVLEAAGCPVVATSVNLSGEPPSVTGEEAAAVARGTAAVVLDAGPCALGLASTVVAVRGEGLEVLREGAVPRREVLEDAARWILFVCTGNICRSPLAAAMAERRLEEARGAGRGGLPEHGLRVLSAGTSAGRGLPATEETVEEGRRRGLDLAPHRSRPLTPGLVDQADRVFAAEAAHVRSILRFLPEARGRVLLLDPGGRDVPDPFGRGGEAYGRAAALMERAVETRAREGSLEGPGTPPPDLLGAAPPGP